jgi:hypothetical protein
MQLYVENNEAPAAPRPPPHLSLAKQQQPAPLLRTPMPSAAAATALAALVLLCAQQQRPAEAAARARRTSRWWFHTLNSSYTELGTAIVRSHPDACTGVYLYMDTFSTHGCAAAVAAHAPCGRFSIGATGEFSSATDAQIAERVRPYQELGVTVTVSMDLTTSSVLDGSAHRGVAAAVATAVRHNLTGLMLDYEPRTNYTEAHERAYASLIKALGAGLHQHGLELDICISDWSILTSFELYAATGVDRMMSMGSTYSGLNVTRDKGWVIAEQAAGVSGTQLAVGIGSMRSACQSNTHTHTHICFLFFF